ncbi:anti-virulence regulator CigR family protein [Pseudomonas amygdali]|uniref:anti-virulence regulator CigR family protein n=1 Tax=Pseudomonas amygdali TaxID=47877 RepID=UPI0006B907C3|nr:anti-virulence regulator CigR family protein [Pseudomonas amygdali]KPB13420.1 putative membrane protein [Pseudomonas amygdali pv. sesami]KPY60104.1 putative membrane protein [Pseudomonas amygdali pv. sesami]RMT98998.1 putative membrane protein [Pseudomonas amygdali pv. sesami]RMT99298.1 putative membrane protein [Pseudomonas amygdali pv. sesami]RMV84599.1 putative membrane protein [Pseudomonas amygdali pv. sesami]
MKLPNRFITGLGILMISASPLLQAAPPDQRGDGPDDNRGGQQQGPQNNGGHNERANDRGPGNDNGRGPDKGPASQPGRQAHRDNRGGNRPPQDFGPVRETFQQHRDVIGRGQPLPPGVHIAKGRPLPPGYGKRLDSRSLQHLPHYDGYEWRRLGTDVVLIAVGSGIVYAILDGVLN